MERKTGFHRSSNFQLAEEAPTGSRAIPAGGETGFPRNRQLNTSENKTHINSGRENPRMLTGERHEKLRDLSNAKRGSSVREETGQRSSEG
jgi:hypothetical protein